MKQYVETAQDLNVRGVELYVKASPDGFVYTNSTCTEKATATLVKHLFEMNKCKIR